MQSFIRKFAVKFLEVAGAGLASALCAYILGQIERAPAPTPMPAVVYISPANVDTALREDHAQPAAIARIDAETPPEAAASAPTGEPKAVKPAAVAQARRNQKPEPGVAAETKPRGGEPIQPAAVAANSAPKATAPAARAAAGRDEAEDWSSGEEDRPLLARLRQIPSWFLPENDRIFGDLPRPPMPVGDSLRSAM